MILSCKIIEEYNIMFVSGNIGDFAERIHKLPSSVADVDLFITEGNSYLSTVMVNISGKWERELRKRKYIFSHNASYLTTQQLIAGTGGSGGGGTNFLLDESSNTIFDELGVGISEE